MMYIKRCIGFIDDTSLNYVRKRYIIETEKYSDSQPRDDRGRWTDGGGDSGGSSGSSINNRRKLVRGKYSTSNEEIDRILTNELSGVSFSVHPVYNSRIASAGKTIGMQMPTGKIHIKSIEIGKQYKNSKEALIDTLIHEELEATGSSKKFSKLNSASDDVRHKYINGVIKNYFGRKGWNYGLV